MTIGFSARTVVSCSALCVAGALVLMPGPAAAHGGAHPGIHGAHTGTDSAPTAPAPGTAEPPPSPLDRPGTQVTPRAGAPGVPRDLSARSWLVADADTGEVLAAHDAHAALPPASTLKTLFAVTVLPMLPPAVRHTVTEADLAGIGSGSSLVGVRAGRTYRASDLWRGVFLNSGNDAVRVLARMNGGWESTAAQMQARARALGARDTRVVSPDGYDMPGQVSSAYDLAVFGRAGLRNTDFVRYCATARATFPGDGRAYEIRNTNRLLTGADGVAPYPGLIGIKNGSTSRAGSTLVAAARRDGHTLVVTVMDPRAGGRFAVYEEARSLLDWGFAALGRVEPVGSLLPRPVARAAPGPAAPTPTRPGSSPATASAPQAGPAAGPAGGTGVSGDDRNWLVTAGTLAGAAGLGGGAVALALRLHGRRGGRSARD
ncbi:D-alanyl-D-alanine carboxypeptidase (penicillin-binding protein 5/6) [Streptomyces sp. V3I8]|uniref:D-alanyl-D-alanine carboxypeptidase family protein n=1 Tax=Streptomyces sp. V3I8 TaxID=3042279 RepID=UPI002785D2E6|nr:serine hydrolase [Streptomyces sp. V3I8]MDQ1040648.1 D-alanyl-D-alanine carboxypeptidase (penicillin-binding protein 5/6) [Streptomyces sp. V3I8]